MYRSARRTTVRPWCKCAAAKLPARKNKAVKRRQGRVDRSIRSLDPRNLPFADPQRLHFAVLPFRTAKVAAEVEEVILDMGQNIANRGILNMQ